MIHYTYKITNTLNGKYYLGMHSQDESSEDTYMGSGKALKIAIKKYGKEAFTKEILGYFSSREELELAEKSLVTLEVVKDRKSYNMKTGGEGGSDSLSKESRLKISKANKGRFIGDKNPMWGKTHTPESIAKTKAKHSLYGKPSPQGLKISINGVQYLSLHEASVSLNESTGSIRGRILSKAYLNYRFTDESKNTHKGINCVKIGSSYYESLRKAEQATGEPRYQIADKIKSNVEGYCYEEITSLPGHR